MVPPVCPAAALISRRIRLRLNRAFSMARRNPSTLHKLTGILLLAGAFMLGALRVACADETEPSDGSAPQAQEERSPVDGDPSTQPRDASKSDAEARAKKKFEEGVQAFEEGRFSDAVDLLEEADRAMPNPAFAYNIALAYDAMGDAAAALAAYRQYMREARGAEDSVEVLERISALEYELQAKGIQQVTVQSTPDHATVELDGRPVGVTPWTGEIAPGRHELTLTKRGYEEASRTFELPRDRAVDVVLALRKRPPGRLEMSAPPRGAALASPARAAGETSPEAASGGAMPDRDRGPAVTAPRRVHAWTWATLGAGGASFAGAFAVEMLRRGSEDDARAASQRDYRDELDRMRSQQRIARILAGVGGVLTATGVGLLVFDLTRAPPSRNDSGPGDSSRAPSSSPGDSSVALTTVELDCGWSGCNLNAKGQF